MKAYVTSIGEPTTDLCVWSLQRNGFEVEVLNHPKTTLARKLEAIYLRAEEDFVRLDADVIVNKRFTPELMTWLPPKNPDIWWWQFIVFDWFKLDIAHTGAFTLKAALPALRANAPKFADYARPETELSRIKEFYEPRRFDTYDDEIMGLHGYKGDINRVKKLKHIRNQTHLYDFEMAERLNSL